MNFPERPAANALIVTLPFGFIDSMQLADLANLEPLCPMLLRWDRGRQVVSAQEVAQLIEALEGAGWGLRDVAVTSSRLQLAQQENSRANPPRVVRVDRSVVFDERQVGGSFDGTRVISDADPGL